MSSSKKFTCKGTLRLLLLFICLRSPPLLGFCLGWSGNFEGSASGQFQSVKLMHNTIKKTSGVIAILLAEILVRKWREK
jgi:hypothetical protein